MTMMPTLTLLLVATAAVTHAHDFQQCTGVTTDHMHVSSLTFTPDEPVPGGDLDAKFTLKPDIDISGGQLHVDIKLFGVHIAGTDFQVCSQLGLTCPLKAGTEYNAEIKYAIPSAAPSGVTVDAIFETKDASKNELGCIQAKVTTGKKTDLIGFEWTYDSLTAVDTAIRTTTGHHAPEIELVSGPVLGTTNSTASYPPVVFLHGMGDSGSNPGMKSICKTASDKYPGLYAVCSNVANGMSSITTVLDKQIEEFTQSVRADPKLANGFTAVGMSQGNLVLRGYIERINDPPVHKFVSICGPHNGVGTCPDNILYKLVCPLWKLAKYTAPIAFSDYWKDVTNKAEYLQKSRWLADINNERDTKNSTYKSNLMSLKKYVLVEAMQDTMVIPHASESHGFWAWGEKGSDQTVVQLRDTDAYKGDWLGLKTMDGNKQLDTYTYQGDHLRFSSQFWDENILPYFAD